MIEFFVALGIGMLAMTAVLAFSAYTGRSFASSWNYVEMEAQSRRALDSMSHEIRQVTFLSDFSTNHLSFLDHDAKVLTFAYLPDQRLLVRAKDGATNVLLTGCDWLSFSIYKRNTTNGTYDQYPTTLQASNCKVVQVTWLCSREVTGTKLNTETVQTAKIVIRNQ